MTRTPPQHGTRACYLRGCRHPECVDANKRYCKAYRVTTLRAPIRIPAAPSIARITDWIERGYSHTQISATTAVNTGELSKLYNHKQQNIHPDVARRILSAADPAGAPYHAMADATGTIRRAQALHLIGYPMYQIAQGVPMATNHLGRLLHRQPATVRLSIANGMTALYKELRWRPGPSQFSPFAARRNGWHGPLAWDDIDDPNCQPETDTYKPIVKGGRDSMRRAEIAHLLSCGESIATIARRMDRDTKYISDLISQGLDAPSYEAAA